MGLADTYADLKAKVVDRKEEFDSFIGMLESETSWLTSPASTRFHLNSEQGLLKHSVAVAENLLKIRDCLASPISDESCVSGTHRVLRGGSWISNPWFCRSANRDRHQPGNRGSNNGFRVVSLDF